MGSLANTLEDFESFLTECLNKDEHSAIREAGVKLKMQQKSFEYRKADLVDLILDGFMYNKAKNEFTKTEDIDWGKYPGKYKISVWFPEDYPKSPPQIRFKPLFTGQYSSHILSGSRVCIARKEHGDPDTYWKSNMNARAAVRLAYFVITEEIERKKDRKQIPIEGNIYKDLMKVVTKEEYIKEFIKPKAKEVDNSYSWGELAYVTSQFKTTDKGLLVEYYNKKQQQKKEKKPKKKKKG